MTTTSTFTVVGMTCGACVRSVKDKVAAIDGVEDVAVHFKSGLVTVESVQPIDDADFAAAVSDAGYGVAS